MRAFVRSHARLLLPAAAVVLAGAVVFEGGPDPVIFPKQAIPIRFNHDYHVRKPDEAKGLKGEGLSCDFCHENVSDSMKSSDRDIPGHDSCDSCHDTWIGDEDNPAPASECARCHVGLESSTASVSMTLSIPTPNIQFPHAEHISEGVGCVECHNNVPSKTVATRDDYPTMDRCIGCHEERSVSTDCQTCHLSGVGGRLLTDLPAGELKPRRLHTFAIHDADFLRDHAVPAMREKEYCDNCHMEEFCLECHDGVVRNVRFHPGDWISIHSIRARIDDNRCQSCHRLQTFCIDCHIRSNRGSVYATTFGDGTKTHGGNVRPRSAVLSPHPTDGSIFLRTSRNFHGFQAQRNIRACASCHQENFCIQCHASGVRARLSDVLGTPGARGINPHGTVEDARRLLGSTIATKNARVCLKCHDPLDTKWRN